MSPRMLRSASLLVVALALTLGSQAARAQASTADLLTRIDRLEQALRELTGTVEQLQYRNQQLEQQVRQMQEQAGPRPDGARAPSPPPRPSAAYPAAGAPGAAAVVASAGTGEAAAAGAPPAGRRSDAFDPAANPNAPGVPRPLGASTTTNEPPPLYDRPAGVTDAPVAGGLPRPAGTPLNLSNLSTGPNGEPSASPAGELPPPPPRTLSSTGATAATSPAGNTPKDQYDLAYGYVLHKDYGLAAETFRAFLRQYPSDRMAAEAQYWLGESLFQQQQYREAAESFLAASTKYETTARAPEALLRLGQSLAALGEKEAACASLGEVLRKYPRATQNIRQSVEREQKRVRC